MPTFISTLFCFFSFPRKMKSKMPRTRSQWINMNSYGEWRKIMKSSDEVVCLSCRCITERVNVLFWSKCSFIRIHWWLYSVYVYLPWRWLIVLGRMPGYPRHAANRNNGWSETLRWIDTCWTSYLLRRSAIERQTEPVLNRRIWWLFVTQPEQLGWVTNRWASWQIDKDYYDFDDKRLWNHLTSLSLILEVMMWVEWNQCCNSNNDILFGTQIEVSWFACHSRVYCYWRSLKMLLVNETINENLTLAVITP